PDSDNVSSNLWVKFGSEGSITQAGVNWLRYTALWPLPCEAALNQRCCYQIRTMKQKLLSLLMAVAITTPAYGNTLRGAPDCRDWINGKGSSTETYSRAWILGYLSGLNLML